MNVYEFETDCNGIRIDVYIADVVASLSRTYAKELIQNNFVEVNGICVKSGYKLKYKDFVKVAIPEPKSTEVKPENIHIDILYEDDYLIVVNKPKGMVVHPSAGHSSKTLVNALMYHCKSNLSDINGVIRPGIVHRIDKDTSGLLVVAKTNDAHNFLASQLRDHSMQREYHAVVEGIISEVRGMIDAPIGRSNTDRKKMAVNTKNGKDAITTFTVLKRYSKETYVKLKLETGRTHQIRVHMSHVGYPVSGDEIYGKKKPKYETNGQVLHAKNLGFLHPKTDEFVFFESDLPEYFKELLINLD